MYLMSYNNLYSLFRFLIGIWNFVSISAPALNPSDAMDICLFFAAVCTKKSAVITKLKQILIVNEIAEYNK